MTGTDRSVSTVEGIPFGYFDRWTARPGERLELKASSATGYDLSVVRLFQCYSGDKAPETRQVLQEWFGVRACEARVQGLSPGSYALSEPLRHLADAETVEVTVLFCPTKLPTAGGGPQVVAGLLGDGMQLVIGIALLAEGRCELRAQTGPGHQRRQATMGGPISTNRWYHARMVLSLPKSSAALELNSLGSAPSGPVKTSADIALSATGVEWCRGAGKASRLVLASRGPSSAGAGGTASSEYFNGRIGSPCVSGASRQADGRSGFSYEWCLGPRTGTPEGVVSNGTGRALLRLVNLPTAGVTGPRWDGSEVDFLRAPEHYEAVHFHDDDLEDARWETTSSVQLPSSLRSGAYAAVLATEAGTRYVPFFVSPPAQASKPHAAVLLPTFTYLAYANEHVREGVADFQGPDFSPSRQDIEISQHREFGLSLYDRHSDGSGVCYSSSRRPVLNLDPSYRFWLFNAPVHLGEDLFLLDWLGRLGHEHDVLTDHLVDEEGPGVLRGYRVVLTGSHPEYASRQLLDALEGFVVDGGKLMYLGGNGHYWVSSVDPYRRHVMEVRRGHAGGRTWESAPGEAYHSTTAEPGGLWRHRGRPPNRLLGIGFSAQGVDDRAPGYRRALSSEHRAEWEFVFDNVDGDDAIGEFGLLLGGAAGNEVDRYDPDRGSPSETVLLATSKGHSDAYQLAHEDILLTAPGQGGTEQPAVHSDVVVVPYSSGGRVFSVGSVTWLGSLAFNGYRNNVARLTQNVLERFLEE